jgi:RNA polymerase sigma factor (sigma-70 family)
MILGVAITKAAYRFPGFVPERITREELHSEILFTLYTNDFIGRWNRKKSSLHTHLTVTARWYAFNHLKEMSKKVPWQRVTVDVEHDTPDIHSRYSTSKRKTRMVHVHVQDMNYATEDEPLSVEGCADVESEVSARDFLEKLRATLTESQKELLDLKVEELSNREIAELYELTVQCIGKRIFGLREKAEHLLNEYDLAVKYQA